MTILIGWKCDDCAVNACHDGIADILDVSKRRLPEGFFSFSGIDNVAKFTRLIMLNSCLR